MEPAELEIIADALKKNIQVKDRTYHLRTYPKCFVGTEAVALLIENKLTTNAEEAVNALEGLRQLGLFNHVTKDHPFKNEYLFYRFTEHEAFHGGPGKKAGGSVASWGDALLGPTANSASNNDVQPTMPSLDIEGFTGSVKNIPVSPLDEYNTTLLDNVKPKDWEDPDPGLGKYAILLKGMVLVLFRYNLVVIGAGAGGLVTSAGAAGVGGRVAIIEEHLMGGDCLNVGCVPSKAIIRCARAAYEARNGNAFGLEIPEVHVNFGKVMERMRRIRAQISPTDSAARFANDLGVDVYQGRARFLSRDSIEVNGKILKFAAAVIATGGTASVPPIKGLKDVNYLTNASFFNLTDLPKRFGVIGPGVIGIELAQCMVRFGSEVTVFGRSGRILEKEDPDAVEIIQKQLEDEGVIFRTRCIYDRIEQINNDSPIQIHFKEDDESQLVEVDALLVAAGRTPNVQNMGLELVGVEFDQQGVKVNDFLQTTNKSIYAVGDCCSKYKFTHVADFMARLVIRNALFYGSGKFSSLLIPWTTYTEPEVAHVGLYEQDLIAKDIKYTKFVKPMADVDRAICDGEETGFVKILVKEGSDKILGATIVASNAGNMISEVSVAMEANFGLGSLAYVIHPYPTQSEAIRQCGDLYNKTRLTNFVKSVFRGLLSWRRK
eukprot:g8160.t1